MGRHAGRHDAAGAVSRRCRGAPRRVHRSGRHGAGERASARRGSMVRRRAGCTRTSRDPCRRRRPAEQVFTAVVEEVSSLVGLERIEFVRYDGDTTGTVIAASGEPRFPPGGPGRSRTRASERRWRVRRARRASTTMALWRARSRAWPDEGFHSAIGGPLTVEGRLWGAIIAISTDPEPISERSEARLGRFTELVATAVANAEARGALRASCSRAGDVAPRRHPGGTRSPA